MRQLGRKGGQRTVELHGSAHMAKIGKIGFAVTVQKYWKGDKDAFCRRLKELGLMAQDPVPENRAWQYPQREGEPW
jgi:hypothetical protein